MLWWSKYFARVHELEGGELLISHAGLVKRFQPTFEFEHAVRLFEDFSKTHGDDFFDPDENIDWFPAIQYFLFHKYLLPSILYADALNYIDSKDLKPFFSGGIKFRSLYRIVRKNSFFDRLLLAFAWHIERGLIAFHNRWICDEFGDMFFQYSAKEMRLEVLRREILGYRKGVTAIGGDFRTILKYFFTTEYFLVATTRHEPLTACKDEDRLLALSYAIISQIRRQYKMYRKLFSSRSIGLRFYGIDDPLYLFPLLFALNRCGVKTIGFQHGLYSLNDFGYAVRKCTHFEWFNKLVVWDDFWAKVYLQINSYFPKNSVLVGIGTEQFDIELTSNPDNYHVLCMYERFLNIGEYVHFIRAMIHAGFKITMKMRPESIHSDLAKEYGLTNQEIEYISFVDRIDSELINRISLIAGCKTSLLYSLLSVGRPIWIFETSYHYLEQVINLKNIRVIRKFEAHRLMEIYDQSIFDYQHIEIENFNLGNALNNIISKIDDDSSEIRFEIGKNDSYTY